MKRGGGYGSDTGFSGQMGSQLGDGGTGWDLLKGLLIFIIVVGGIVAAIYFGVQALKKKHDQAMAQDAAATQSNFVNYEGRQVVRE